MRLPRNVSGSELAKQLESMGYRITRQTGSHMRLTLAAPPEHHITIPAHDALRLGTLAAILASVGTRLGMSKDEIAERLFA